MSTIYGIVQSLGLNPLQESAERASLALVSTVELSM